MKIPVDPALDATLALRREGYLFIDHRCQRLGTDVFRTRLLLQPAICMRGAAAAELFYDDSKIQRAGAMPGRLKRPLFGAGGVQGLDDDPHRARKAAFLAVLDPSSIELLVEDFVARWRAAVEKWRGRRVQLLDELERLITASACAHAGVPLEPDEVRVRRDQLVAQYMSAALTGPRRWMGRVQRLRAERWLGKIVDEVRAGRRIPPARSALALFAAHRDPDGRHLSSRTAAVEILSVLRPTVAVSRFIVYAALALHEHPHTRPTSEASRAAFVEEVRRLYPLFPATIGRTRRAFTWKGLDFPAGVRVLLDLYGTNHDPRRFHRPTAFDPSRFSREGFDRFSPIAHGGGDPADGHRCPGELTAAELMKASVHFLLDELAYRVPPQDLRIDLAQIPAAPRSGFLIEDVRLVDRRPPPAVVRQEFRPSVVQ